ncbi:NUDIX domain-containing protein [Actinokineospora globicatena]|uniref:ADP-ribose pyrophosphatase n=1 Tax=Actinokineospora globicatena TaxID=103729 RepID=A0A9W6QS22_9PSEU|nr:NUDIX hydrolase [Actinokineospora globicatena]MCP2305752.1 ADP-ribose pyrophosphatase [Actinokineospora globicatena]GLW80393.1 ADP-ribose pyrophosphatase [Actinokineospora globicatena]GLW87222.1 ADP-ribose pyrophosphatase [Actinokineospora globicatena]GLW93577.1 ADP-ribose pyrophosphatase [Actinokineospora globicatena]
MSAGEPEAGTHVFDVVSTRDIHVGRILALRLDEVAMPGGTTANREVVEHLGAVAVVAVDDDGAVALIHQYRHPVGARLWELPAGLIDHADEDPLEAARRELVEEVGLAAATWSVLVDIAVSPGFTDEVVRVYLATGLSTVDRVLLGEEEADLVIARVPLPEAVRRVLAGEITNAAAVAGLLAAQAVTTGVVEARPADAPWSGRPTAFERRT